MKNNTLIKNSGHKLLTIKTSEQRQWHRFGVLIVNFEYSSWADTLFWLPSGDKT